MSSIFFHRIRVKAWIIPIILLVMTCSACAAEEPVEFVAATEVVAVEATNTGIPIPSSTPTMEPVSSPTETEVPLTFTPTHTPSDTPTPEPTFTHTPEPSPTPTVYPIPTLERVLYLASSMFQGSDVDQIQDWLFSLGYDEVGSPDGIFGSLSDQAVRHFQEDQGLEVDGVVGQATWDRLYALSKTKQVESRLKELGYGICTENEYFTNLTASAIKKFQDQNGLEPSGFIDVDTWKRLFSGDANPLLHGSSISISNLGELESYGPITFGGNSLWFAGEETLLQIDPLSGFVINRFPIPEVGSISDQFGVVYPKTFIADDALVYNDQVWIMGRVLTYPNLSASAVMVFNFAGDLVKGPIYLSPNVDELIFSPALFSFGGKIWGVRVVHPQVTLVEINPLNFQVGRSFTLRNVSHVYNTATDGETIWITLILDEDRTLTTINLNTGNVGAPLDACGYNIVYDGEWLWVERASSLYAVDPLTGEIVANAHADGSIMNMATDGDGKIWILVNESKKWYLQVLNAR